MSHANWNMSEEVNKEFVLDIIIITMVVPQPTA